MAKNIYFIGGLFARNAAADDAQRESFWTKYGLMLHEVLGEEIRQDPNLRRFKFVPVWKADRDEFIKIWTNESTYGVFWLGHGTTSGYPLAYNYKLDEPWQKLTGKEIAAANMKPAHFTDENGTPVTRSSKNLRFVAFLGCKIGQHASEWKEQMPAGADFYSYSGDMGAYEGTGRTQLDLWIRNHFADSAQRGARYLFRQLAQPSQVSGAKTQSPDVRSLLAQKHPLRVAAATGTEKRLSYSVRPFSNLPATGGYFVMQQQQQMEAQRLQRRWQQEAHRRTQQQFENQQQEAREVIAAQQQRAWEEAARRRRIQEAQRRAQAEAEQRRVIQGAARHGSQEKAQNRAREESRRRQLALELARLKQPTISSARPELWLRPKGGSITGGPQISVTFGNTKVVPRSGSPYILNTRWTYR